MSLKTIFISNLSYEATENDLKGLLEEYKPSHVRLVTERDTARSRGFGFAEFSDEDGFKRCIDELDGSHFKGRPLTVKEAEPRKTNRTSAQ